MPVPKTRNNGQWTEARYRAFVRSALRQAWQKWGPNHEAKKRARIRRGEYLCAGYKCDPHIVPTSIKVDGKRKNNIFTDHIDPIGAYETWDRTIERMFCELPNLQVLCRACHDQKTKDERAMARKK